MGAGSNKRQRAARHGGLQRGTPDESQAKSFARWQSLHAYLALRLANNAFTRKVSLAYHPHGLHGGLHGEAHALACRAR